MVSLMIGIASLVLMAVGYLVESLALLIWLGFALGIVAWVLGAKAVKRDKSDSKAKIGKVIGIIATIIGIILIIFVVLVAGLAIGLGAAL